MLGARVLSVGKGGKKTIYRFNFNNNVSIAIGTNCSKPPKSHCVRGRNKMHRRGIAAMVEAAGVARAPVQLRGDQLPLERGPAGRPAQLLDAVPDHNIDWDAALRVAVAGDLGPLLAEILKHAIRPIPLPNVLAAANAKLPKK